MMSAFRLLLVSHRELTMPGALQIRLGGLARRDVELLFANRLGDTPRLPAYEDAIALGVELGNGNPRLALTIAERIGRGAALIRKGNGPAGEGGTVENRLARRW